MTCHVDAKRKGGNVFDNCVFDYFKIEDCNHAVKLQAKGLARKDCIHWVNETKCPTCGHLITVEKK